MLNMNEYYSCTAYADAGPQQTPHTKSIETSDASRADDDKSRRTVNKSRFFHQVNRPSPALGAVSPRAFQKNLKVFAGRFDTEGMGYQRYGKPWGDAMHEYSVSMHSFWPLYAYACALFCHVTQRFSREIGVPDA